jgi:hypothetical protein
MIVPVVYTIDLIDSRDREKIEMMNEVVMD